MEVVSAAQDVIPPTATTIDDDPTSAYTIIRVKRKLVSSASSGGDDNPAESFSGYHSFKRLRHLGSFTTSSNGTANSAPDEEAIRRNSLLKMGLSGQKRVRFSDLNLEQFSAYVETLGEKKEVEEVRKRRKVKKVVTFEKKIGEEAAEKVASDAAESQEEAGLFSIGLTQEDFASPLEVKSNESQSAVTTTCNGAVLEELPSSQEELEKDPQYVYDYYLMVDYVLSFEEPADPRESAGDDPWDADSNDENYRYNDYPDEDEFDDDDSDGDSSSSSSSTNFGSNSDDDDGERLARKVDDSDEDAAFDKEYYDEVDEDEDDEWIRDVERRMRRARITDDLDGDDGDSDDNSSSESDGEFD